MGAMIRVPAGPVRSPERILGGFDRDQLANFIEVAIALLDATDGDPDVEADGDELDGGPAEDDFWPHVQLFAGPGCPLSDPGGESAR